MPRPQRYLQLVVILALASSVTACNMRNLFNVPQKPQPIKLEASDSVAKQRIIELVTVNGIEYFSEDATGVAASPRVLEVKAPVPRGGGRIHIGKPYQVGGRWYYPSDKPQKQQVGLASWYGDAFHGRLTANGEIYDVEHLTAAHPTMPLPSYAKVTNLHNGATVTVRVNDRGPYSKGRVIDLSKKAAHLLAYAEQGTTKVKVEYLGPAPLDGDDTRYLLASYRPGAQEGEHMVAELQLPTQGPLLKARPQASSTTALAQVAHFVDKKELALPATGPQPMASPMLARAGGVNEREVAGSTTSSRSATGKGRIMFITTIEG